MNENAIRGGAAPALAAHSKDGATPGQTPASGMAGDNGATNSQAEAVGAMAKNGMEQVRNAAGSVRETLSDGTGRAADQAAEFIRAQPMIALSVTGAICFAFGVLLGRR